MQSIEYDESAAQPSQTILCCQCGTPIAPNPANMCVVCIRTHVDITEGIPKQATIFFCRNCERYLQPPSQWIAASLESKELLSVCLKKLKGLKAVRLVDAGFVWTEPHSKRLKVKLTIQKEVLNGAMLQQVFIVEFVVHNQMCDDCHRTEAKDFWKSVVQLRQKASHKKTMYYLEQAILKHKAHTNTLNIKEMPDGIDFFYGQPQDSRKFVEFLQAVVPCRYVTSKKLVSHDIRSNIHNYKTTFSVEIAPICKDDIICLSPKLSAAYGNIGQLVICSRVTTAIHLLNPSTLQMAEVNSTLYWKSPFASLATSKQLQEYLVMQVDIIAADTIHHNSSVGAISSKHVLADVWVCRSSDMSADQIHCRSHLGHLLQPGDTALGFDLSNSNVNDVDLDKLSSDKKPDLILVKKQYSDKGFRNRQRKWKLLRLEREAAMSANSNERDYTDFMEDLEEDETLRHNVNIYKDHRKVAVEADADTPQISLEEMLDDLTLTEDATGGAGSAMME
ncbi:60S ribosomal export protein NMD3-like [Watersipora subatra]|uniref:60S ribosomal export protein NMD3-like n=1 Tax=Watersipora subatra TaxID=2589382 RepID=UPI00355B0D2D